MVKQERSQNLHHFYPGTWLKWGGGASGFSHDQNDRGLLDAQFTSIYCSIYECEDKHA